MNLRLQITRNQAAYLQDLRTTGVSGYTSPDVLDLVLWNVVIAYAINLAASGSYELFRSLWKRFQGRVPQTHDEQEQYGDILEVELKTLSLSNHQEAKATALRVVARGQRAGAEKILESIAQAIRDAHS
jgi:hypothetical protein